MESVRTGFEGLFNVLVVVALTSFIAFEDNCMTTMITARIDLQTRKTVGEVFSEVERTEGIKIGIADGKYAFNSDFDKKFDEMDAEIEKMFC